MVSGHLLRQQPGIQLHEVQLVSVDAALLQELQKQVLPALLAQNQPAQRMHQRLALPVLPPFNHDRHRSLDRLTPWRIQLPS